MKKSKNEKFGERKSYTNESYTNFTWNIGHYFLLIPPIAYFVFNFVKGIKTGFNIEIVLGVIGSIFLFIVVKFLRGYLKKISADEKFIYIKNYRHKETKIPFTHVAEISEDVVYRSWGPTTIYFYNETIFGKSVAFSTLSPKEVHLKKLNELRAEAIKDTPYENRNDKLIHEKRNLEEFNKIAIAFLVVGGIAAIIGFIIFRRMIGWI